MIKVIGKILMRRRYRRRLCRGAWMPFDTLPFQEVAYACRARTFQTTPGTNARAAMKIVQVLCTIWLCVASAKSNGALVQFALHCDRCRTLNQLILTLRASPREQVTYLLRVFSGFYLSVCLSVFFRTISQTKIDAAGNTKREIEM